VFQVNGFRVIILDIIDPIINPDVVSVIMPDGLQNP